MCPKAVGLRNNNNNEKKNFNLQVSNVADKTYVNNLT